MTQYYNSSGKFAKYLPVLTKCVFPTALEHPDACIIFLHNWQYVYVHM